MAETIQLKIQLNAGDASAVVQELTTKVSNLGGSVKSASGGLQTFDDVATKVGFRLQGITSIFNVLHNTFGSWISESNSGEVATTKLTQALQNQGLYSNELVKDIQEYAAARQEATGIDDDATIAIAGQLTAMGLRGQALKDAITATQDLSTLMDGDMNGAVRVVADAFSGNTGMLSRYIKGLDETDIKQRGLVSIVEQLNTAIGGQAEAVGNTGAGSIKKFNASLSDLQQSFGDILKQYAVPMLNLATVILEKINALPEPIKVLTGSITALGIAYGFLNTQFGATPYLILSLAGSIVGLLSSLKEMNPLIAGTTALFAVLAIGLIALNLQSTLLALGFVNNLIPTFALVGSKFIPTLLVKIGALTFSLTALQLAMLGIVGVIAAVGVALYTYFKSQSQAAADALRNIHSSYGNMTKEIIADIDSMPMLEDKLKLTDGYIEGVVKNIDVLLDKLIALKNSHASAEEIAQTQKAYDEEINLYNTLRNHKEQLRNDDKKDRSAVDADVRKMRVQRMTDEVAKAKEQAAIELEEEKKKNAEKAKSKKQLGLLNSESQKNYHAKIKAIDAQAAFEKEKFDNEQLIKAAERKKSELDAKLDADEKVKLSTATTEANRTAISKEFAEKRIRNERNAAIAAIDANEAIIKAQIAATHDPEKIRELTASLNELQQVRKSINDKAINSIIGLDADDVMKQNDLKKSLDEEYKQFKINQEKDEFVRAKKLNQQKYEDQRQKIRDTIKDNTAQKDALNKINEQQAAADAIIDEQKKQMQIQNTMDVVNFIGQSVGQQTALGKTAAIASATMNTYEAATKALTAPFPLNLILEPLVIGLGLANVAKIINTQTPRFATGGVVPGSGNEDNVLALLTPGERIMRKSVSQQHGAFLDALNAGAAIPAQQVIVQTTNDGGLIKSLKKEIKNLAKKLNQQIIINAETVPAKFSKAEEQSARYRAAVAL